VDDGGDELFLRCSWSTVKEERRRRTVVDWLRARPDPATTRRAPLHSFHGRSSHQASLIDGGLVVVADGAVWPASVLLFLIISRKWSVCVASAHGESLPCTVNLTVSIGASSLHFFVVVCLELLTAKVVVVCPMDDTKR
jgi:hypothetical protein